MRKVQKEVLNLNIFYVDQITPPFQVLFNFWTKENEVHAFETHHLKTNDKISAVGSFFRIFGYLNIVIHSWCD